jgi:curved DNA-binding protein CbpA
MGFQSSDVPVPARDVDVRKLEIGPEEAFVHSRVDGRASVREIGFTTGLPEPRVVAALSRLVTLGAVVPLPPAANSEPPRTDRRAKVSSDRTQPSLSSGAPAARTSGSPKIVDAALQQRVDELFTRLGRDDLYQLLSVPRTAQKAVIKTAYFQLVSDFHPDRYYGQELGPLKPKMEQVFQALTEAWDTLGKAKRRAEYDAALNTRGEQQKSVPPAIAVTSSRPDVPRSGEASARPSLHPQVTSRPAPSVPRSPDPSFAPPKVPRPQSFTPDARRPSLAPSPSHPPTQNARASLPPRESLFPHLYPPGGPSSSAGARSQRYVRDAEQHLQEDNPSAAANALRLALALTPEDAELKERLSEAERKSNQKASPALVAAAQQHERNAAWGQAARNYAKAAQGREGLPGSDSALLYAQAAQCLLSDALGDRPGATSLREAGELARKAASLAPNDADIQLVLGRIYVEAGMPQSAISALEKAASLKPADGAIHQLLARLKPR